MTIANIGNQIPTGQLNFKAYKPEQPTYATHLKPEGTVNSAVDIKKEIVAGNPVFNQPQA